MSDFPNAVKCLLQGGAMDGQYIPIDKDINRIEMFTKDKVIAYVRVNENTFRLEEK